MKKTLFFSKYCFLEERERLCPSFNRFYCIESGGRIRKCKRRTLNFFWFLSDRYEQALYTQQSGSTVNRRWVLCEKQKKHNVTVNSFLMVCCNLPGKLKKKKFVRDPLRLQLRRMIHRYVWRTEATTVQACAGLFSGWSGEVYAQRDRDA